MERVNLIYIVLTLFLFCNSCSALRPTITKPNTKFIRTHCGATKFPRLCYISLSSYAPKIHRSPTQLAHAALSVSMDGAQATTAMMAGMSKGGKMPRHVAATVADCIENLQDSVESLRQSIIEMGNVRPGKDMGFEVNSIQTWVSTALTDEHTCMENFDGNAMDASLKSKIRERVVNVAKLTSNALALVNALSSIAQP